MFKKLLFAVLFLATTANVSGSIASVKRSYELRNVVEKRQSGSIPVSEFPRQCQKTCAPAITALNGISKCSSATCICTKAVDDSFQGCINCIVKIESAGGVVPTLKQLASEYNELCAGTGVSSLTVGVASTTKSSPPPSTSPLTHTSTGKTSPTSSPTSTTASSPTTSPTSSPTSTSSPSTTSGSLTDTSSPSSATNASSATSATNASSVTNATGATSISSNTVSLTPTSTSTATASASATSSNAAITRANAGVEYPLMALITTLFALAF